MTAPDRRLATFLQAVDKLPPLAAVSYRGRPTGAPVPNGRLVTTGITSTSLDASVAREGGAVAEVFVIAGRTGRSLSALSANPAEQEVVFLPGTALAPLGSLLLPASGVTVHLLEELVVDEAVAADGGLLPPDLHALVAHIDADLSRPDSGTSGPPGKFAGPLQ